MPPYHHFTHTCVDLMEIYHTEWPHRIFKPLFVTIFVIIFVKLVHQTGFHNNAEVQLTSNFMKCPVLHNNDCKYAIEASGFIIYIVTYITLHRRFE